MRPRPKAGGHTNGSLRRPGGMTAWRSYELVAPATKTYDVAGVRSISGTDSSDPPPAVGTPGQGDHVRAGPVPRQRHPLSRAYGDATGEPVGHQEVPSTRPVLQ